VVVGVEEAEEVEVVVDMAEAVEAEAGAEAGAGAGAGAGAEVLGGAAELLAALAPPRRGPEGTRATRSRQPRRGA
jgi:hypothetical protein